MSQLLNSSNCLKCTQYGNEILQLKKDFKFHVNALNNDNKIMKHQIDQLLNNSVEPVNFQREIQLYKQRIDLLIKTNEAHVNEIKLLQSTKNDLRRLCVSCSKPLKELQERVIESNNIHNGQVVDTDATVSHHMEAVYKKYLQLEKSLARERKWAESVNNNHKEIVSRSNEIEERNVALKAQVECLEKQINELKQSKSLINEIPTDENKVKENKKKTKPTRRGNIIEDIHNESVARCQKILTEIPNLPIEKFKIVEKVTDQLNNVTKGKNLISKVSKKKNAINVRDEKMSADSKCTTENENASVKKNIETESDISSLSSLDEDHTSPIKRNEKGSLRNSDLNVNKKKFSNTKRKYFTEKSTDNVERLSDSSDNDEFKGTINPIVGQKIINDDKENVDGLYSSNNCEIFMENGKENLNELSTKEDNVDKVEKPFIPCTDIEKLGRNSGDSLNKDTEHVAQLSQLLKDFPKEKNNNEDNLCKSPSKRKRKDFSEKFTSNVERLSDSSDNDEFKGTINRIVEQKNINDDNENVDGLDSSKNYEIFMENGKESLNELSTKEDNVDKVEKPFIPCTDIEKLCRNSGDSLNKVTEQVAQLSQLLKDLPKKKNNNEDNLCKRPPCTFDTIVELDFSEYTLDLEGFTMEGMEDHFLALDENLNEFAENNKDEESKNLESDLFQGDEHDKSTIDHCNAIRTEEELKNCEIMKKLKSIEGDNCTKNREDVEVQQSGKCLKRKHSKSSDLSDTIDVKRLTMECCLASDNSEDEEKQQLMEKEIEIHEYEMPDLDLTAVDFSVPEFSEEFLSEFTESTIPEKQTAEEEPTSCTNNLLRAAKLTPENIQKFNDFVSFFEQTSLLPELNLSNDERNGALKKLHFISNKGVKRKTELQSIFREIFQKKNTNQKKIIDFFSLLPHSDEVFNDCCFYFMTAVRCALAKISIDQILKIADIIPRIMAQNCAIERGLEIFTSHILKSLTMSENVPDNVRRGVLLIAFNTYRLTNAVDHALSLIVDILLFTKLPLALIVSCLDHGFLDYSDPLLPSNWFIGFMRLLFQSEYRLFPSSFQRCSSISEIGAKFWLDGVSKYHDNEICYMLKDRLKNNPESLDFINSLFSIVKKRFPR